MENNVINQILPDMLMKIIEKYNFKEIYEIRLRRNAPIVINFKGKNMALTGKSEQMPYVTGAVLEYVLKRATEFSLYAYNNQLKQGFITTNGGLRLGIAGESVNSDNFMPTTIKNITSINIRVPHEVVGCADVAFKYIYNKEIGVKNTLIISPPGAGKTTLLRDIARKLSNLDVVLNSLLVDERFELAAVCNGEAQMDVGAYSDIVSGATKMFAFTNGIRALKPDVIITDELLGEEDVKACKNAINSGVKVIASVHANDHRSLLNKTEFKDLGINGLFERFIILSNKNGPGSISAILDENLKALYF